MKENGGWRWQDLSDWDYTNWLSGHPNYYFSNADYLYMRTTLITYEPWYTNVYQVSKWIDEKQDIKHSFVCQN